MHHFQITKHKSTASCIQWLSLALRSPGKVKKQQVYHHHQWEELHWDWGVPEFPWQHLPGTNPELFTPVWYFSYCALSRQGDGLSKLEPPWTFCWRTLPYRTVRWHPYRNCSFLSVLTLSVLVNNWSRLMQLFLIYSQISKS